MERRLLLGWAAASVATRLASQIVDDAGVWLHLREELLRDSAYFDMIRDALLPITEGTVVIMEPATRPSALLIGIETPLVAELRLQITRNGEPARMRSTPPRKSRIHFHNALITAWKPRPFLLTASVAEMDLDF